MGLKRTNGESDRLKRGQLLSSGSQTFDYQPRTRLVFGVDTVDRAGELAAGIGAKKVLLVTDPGIVAAGHARRVANVLTSAGLDVVLFDRVAENPTTACVDACLAVAREHRIDTLVGLGGGSSMDTAKGCNFLYTNGGRIQDYWGVGKATKPMLPLIAIPTTAGTGSECQSFALISDALTHQKMACGDPKAAARIALLDPALTTSQPLRVTACTGIDALAHAVETAVTTKRNPLSLIYSHEAFKLCFRSLPKVIARPELLVARGEMLLGAALAGLAIENSMLGAAHSAANPLTAHFNVIHGQAVGIMLPHVVRFNAKDSDARHEYAELASAGKMSGTESELVEALIHSLGDLLQKTRMPKSLAEVGVDRKLLPLLADEAAQQWTGTFNPRPVGPSDFLQMFEAAFGEP